jgi:hypothetical protein
MTAILEYIRVSTMVLGPDVWNVIPTMRVTNQIAQVAMIITKPKQINSTEE